MAHLAKYPQCALGHMLNHYARTADDGVKRKNENIKPNLTHKNYNLASEIQPMNLYDFVKKRLSEIKVQKRADVNLVCDWALTAPKDLKEEEYQKFFKTAFDFMANRYGKENVVSAFVHMDETTPHMHFAFVPVVIDKKKKIPKLSAKEATPRADLRSFHNDLAERMKEVFGRDIGILNEATKEGNKAIEDLRRETSKAEIAMQKERLEIEKAKTAPIEARNVLLNVAQRKNKLEVGVSHRKKYLVAGEDEVTISLEDFKKMEFWVNIGLNAKGYVDEAEKVFSEWQKTANNLLTKNEQSALLEEVKELRKNQKNLEKNLENQLNVNSNLEKQLEKANSYKLKAEECEEYRNLALEWKRKAENLENENSRLVNGVQGVFDVNSFYEKVRKNNIADFDRLCEKYCEQNGKTVTLESGGTARTYGQRVRQRTRDDYSR